MDAGALLTRGTVWLALTLYVGGEIARLFNRTGRLLNTAGCTAFLAHVACAFHFYHSWNHSAAYAATAHQTADTFGWNSGLGLYINYLFAAIWLTDAVWSWSNKYATRPAWITRAIRTFFWFMMVNGAVIFAQGPLRWFGLLLSVVLIACWWPRRKV